MVDSGKAVTATSTPGKRQAGAGGDHQAAGDTSDNPLRAWTAQKLTRLARGHGPDAGDDKGDHQEGRHDDRELGFQRARGVKELGQERRDENQALGIGNGDDKALHEEALARCRRCVVVARQCRAAPLFDAEIDEIERTRPAQPFESLGNDMQQRDEADGRDDQLNADTGGRAGYRHQRALPTKRDAVGHRQDDARPGQEDHDRRRDDKGCVDVKVHVRRPQFLLVP